jgi:hypothetical protein
MLGLCPAPVTGMADITSLYTLKYGIPTPGTKVFVHTNQLVDGHESIPTVFSAIVTTA